MRFILLVMKKLQFVWEDDEMFAIICDICKEQIKGDYKEVYPASTGLVSSEILKGHSDLCMKCWKMFTEYKRIPLVEFPNKEVGESNGERK